MQLSPEFFINNRKKLVNSLPKKGLIIVAGNGRLQRNSDSTYPFRQDSNFYYLTGIEEPCATLVIDTKQGESWVMLPLRTGVKAIFEGEIDIQQLRTASGIDEIITEAEGLARLKKYHHDIAYMPQSPKTRLDDMYTNPHRATIAKQIRSIVSATIDIREELSRLRSLKEAEEIELIDTAARITLDTIDLISSQFGLYKSESDIESALLSGFKAQGARGHAFSPIVASGSASCMLHYEANNKPISKPVVLLDVGAEVSNYSADISRTLLLADESRVSDIHSAVQEAQQTIIKQLKPGLTWQEYAEISDKEVGSQLLRLGLVKKGYTKDQLRQYFPHAIGHFLGLDTHDAGVYSEPLEPNMVITTEPGIYIPDEGFGIRIEDDIQITKTGAKILGL